MKKIIFSIFVWLIVMIAVAQDSANVGKESFRMYMGSSFGSMQGLSVGSSYMMPVYMMPLTSRFTFIGGAVLSHTGFPGNQHAMGMNGMPLQSYSNNTVFAGGTFFATEKLRISGIGFKTLGSPMNATDPVLQKNDYSGMILNVDYKLSDKVYFQGHFNLNSNWRYPSNAFYNRGFMHSSPFDNMWYNW